MKTPKAILASALLWLSGLPLVSAQSSAFTYQGRLNDAGEPAHGTYNFQFTVRDAASGGNAVGVNPLAATLAVSNGLFTVTLDPGAGVFTGADRWLFLSVKTNGAVSFTPLTPPQKITATPYAIAAGNLSGSLSSANLSGTYANALTLNNAANSLSGNGANLTALNASRLASGTIPDARLSANVALRGGGNAFTGNQTIAGNVGIGTTTPGTSLEIRGATPAGPSLRLTGVGGYESKVGIDLATYDPVLAGVSNVAARIETSDWNWSAGIDFQTKVPGEQYSALVSRLFIQNGGNVGIGTTSPVTALHVAGTVTAERFVAIAAESPANVLPVLGMVWIKPGTFIMGSREDELGRSSDEGPQTVVTITKGFWMGVHEVTQGEYLKVVGSNPSFFFGDLNRPVELVDWFAATNYCRLLTQTERIAGRLPPAGWGYRLPTEAEWEYACRAGARTTRFSYGDDLSYAALGNYAWYGTNSLDQTHPVEQKLANPWGLMDMHGNVWEWCQDWYGAYPGQSVVDSQGPVSGSARVIRGGGWGYDGSYCRSAQRSNYAQPAFRYYFLGFRAVLAPGQP